MVPSSSALYSSAARNRGGHTWWRSKRGGKKKQERIAEKMAGPLSKSLDDPTLNDWQRFELMVAQDTEKAKIAARDLRKAGGEWADWGSEKTEDKVVGSQGQAAVSQGRAAGSQGRVAGGQGQAVGRVQDRRVLDLLEQWFELPQGSIGDLASARRLLTSRISERALAKGDEILRAAEQDVPEVVAGWRIKQMEEEAERVKRAEEEAKVPEDVLGVSGLGVSGLLQRALDELRKRKKKKGRDGACGRGLARKSWPHTSCRP
jgi:hypothetical protein